MGDTGLWFVPAGDVLKDKQWSASGYFENSDVAKGSTDSSHFAGTFAYGVRGRVEIFGAVMVDTRIDRDTRPIFNTMSSGGVDAGYPFVVKGWSGDHFGDTFLGVKANITSQSRQNPVAFAIRPFVKLPTGSKADGTGTGKADFAIDGIVSGEVAKRAEVSGTVGFMKRGDPSELDLPDSVRWGFGAQFPTRNSLRLTTELYGAVALFSAGAGLMLLTFTKPLRAWMGGAE